MKTTVASVAIALAICLIGNVAAAGTDKTLVSWVILDNTTQQGGSALTIQRGDQFDGIVFGERAPGKWMAGSNFFARTQGDQQANAVEKADSKTPIQMVIAYKGNQISIYRNGDPYASYEASNIDLLSARDNMAVFGLRHEGAGTGQTLRGLIEDARIYDRALTADEIKKLEPKKESVIKPFAWWTFEKGKETDRMGRFPVNHLTEWGKDRRRSPGSPNPGRYTHRWHSKDITTRPNWDGNAGHADQSAGELADLPLGPSGPRRRHARRSELRLLLERTVSPALHLQPQRRVRLRPRLQ